MIKRGLSEVVTTVLIILVVLASIAIIWVAVKPLLQIGEELDSGQFSVSLQITKANYDNNTDIVGVNLRRNAGTGEVVAFQIVLIDIVGNSAIVRNDTLIQELEEKEIFVDYSSYGLDNLAEIGIAPVFLINGKEKIGSIVDVWKFGDGGIGFLGEGGGNNGNTCPYGNNIIFPNTCDVRLTLQGYYPQWNSNEVGIDLTGKGIVFHGSSLEANFGDSIDDFLSYTESDIRISLRNYIQNRGIDPLTDDLIILDIEHPIHPSDIWTFENDPVYNQIDIINNFAIRIRVAREELPNAKIAVYLSPLDKVGDRNSAITINRMRGFRTAGQFGMFDYADYIIPVMYQWFEPNTPNHDTLEQFTRMHIEEFQTLTNSVGTSMDVLPLLGIVYRENTTETEMLITSEDQQFQMSVVQEYNINLTSYWHHPNYDDLSENYFKSVKVVPAVCFCD